MRSPSRPCRRLGLPSLLAGLVVVLLCGVGVASAQSIAFTGSLVVPQPTCAAAPDSSCVAAASAVVSAEAYVQTCVRAVLTASTASGYQSAVTVLAQAVVDLQLAISLKIRVCAPEIVTRASLQAEVDAAVAIFVSANAELTAALSGVVEGLPVSSALTAGADATLKLQAVVLAIVAQVKAQIRLDLYVGFGGSCPSELSLDLNAKIAVLLQACASLEAALVGTDSSLVAAAQVQFQASIYAVAQLKIKLSLLCVCSLPLPTCGGSLVVPQPTCANTPTASCDSAISVVASAQAHVQARVQAVLTAVTAAQLQTAISLYAQAIVDLELAISAQIKVCPVQLVAQASLQADLDDAISVFATARAELGVALSAVASVSGAVPFNTALVAGAQATLKLEAVVLAIVAQIKAQIRLDLYFGLGSGSCPSGLSLDINAKITLLLQACASLEAALVGHDLELLAAAQVQLEAAIYAVAQLKIKLSLLCPCTSGGGGFIVGDPQFIGLRGQSYQVHGISGEIYNIVSDTDLQYNSKFVFLDSGACPVVKGKKQKGCWSHPGSYLGEIGIKARTGERVLLVSGPAKLGFERVEIDGKALAVGDTVILGDNLGSVTRNSTHLASVIVGNWDFAFESSDMFVNQRVKVRDSRQLRSHGMLGQTWRETTYPNPIKYIQGQVDDYVIRDGDIFGDDFLYNTFN